MLIIALVSIMWGTRWRSRPRRAPGDRLLERRADGLHPARDLLAAAPGRPGRAAADGQPRVVTAAAFFVVAALAARSGGARSSATWAASRSGRRCSRPVPDRHVREPGDARLVELHRRVHDPARRCSRRRSRSRVIAFARGRRRRLLRAAPVHHRDAQPRRAPRCARARSGSARRWRSCRSCVVILVLAFYPQFGLQASEPIAATRRSRRAQAQVAAAAVPRRRRARHAVSDGARVDEPLLLAAAHIKGPHIDWAALSPLVVLAVGGAGRAAGRPVGRPRSASGSCRR